MEPSIRIASADKKLFIDRAQNPEFAARMERCFQQGEIVPFPILFRESRHTHLTDSEKQGMDIIQFGFLVTDADGKILLTDRVSHVISKRLSVMIGWSPSHPPGCYYPASENHIFWAYSNEVDDRHLSRPKLYFLGLIMNWVKGIRYYFYVFNVAYSEKDPLIKRLEKERDDEILGFHEINSELLDKISDKKADLRAIQLLTNSSMEGFDFGESQVVPHNPAMPPPFLIHPPSVFISHATGDDAAAKELQAILKVAGITYWVDHQTISPGEQWFSEIEEGVKYGRVFVLLCSQNTAGAPGVTDEIQMALERLGREPEFPIFPVALDGNRVETNIPPEFKRFWAADLREDSQRITNWGILVQKIKERMAAQPDCP